MMSNDKAGLTPREIVGELDRYIVGQDSAKRAVAIALRNRWRRQRVPEEMRADITPKNILMIGPTGVGKTEIARRLAKLIDAPFVKVEASKFTEVGYVGRDVESMVRDLVEEAVNLERQAAERDVAGKAEKAAEERILDLLLPPSPVGNRGAEETSSGGEDKTKTRETFRRMLREGKLDERIIEVEVTQKAPMSMIQNFSNEGVQDMVVQLQDMMGMRGGGGPKKQRKVTVKDARTIVRDEEAAKLVDNDAVQRGALARAEEMGIIFIDEIDKIISRGGGGGSGGGPDVSREGVQRDLLPIVEGSTVTTKYGRIKTDHVLFIAAGAFHGAKVSDLIPELQGRFPIRVELAGLSGGDLVRILREPKNSLLRQYEALLSTEGLTLEITDDAITEIAKVAEKANQSMENIGARRLHTVLETLLEDISFDAPERREKRVVIDRDLVVKKLHRVLDSEDLSRFVL